MGNKNDGQHSQSKKGELYVYAKDSDLEKYGNSETKTLAKAYQEFTKDGVLNDKEIQALKAMDNALKEAELIPGFDSDAALLVQDEGKTSFLVMGTAYKQKNSIKTPQK